MMNLRSTDVQERFPALSNESRSDRVSEKYSFLNTLNIADVLESQGWFPESVSQKNTKRNSKVNPNHTLHSVTFRRSDTTFDNMFKEEIPQITLVNSHDGTNALKFYMGLYRLVCSNGLVIPSGLNFESTIKHLGHTEKEVCELLRKATDSYNDVFKNIELMKNRELEQPKAISYSKNCLKSRYKDKADSVSPFDLLLPLRKEDVGTSLWKRYNVVQEKLINGGTMWNEKTKKRANIRKIKSIKNDIKLNTDLWKITERYLTS